MKCVLKIRQGFFIIDAQEGGDYGSIPSLAIILILFAFIIGCVIIGNNTSASAELFINEFMADNDSLIEDPDEPNAFEDWIEIYNASDSPVDMSRMFLTDDLANPTQWQIPDGIIIASGGYQLFWADNDEEQGDTHTGFKLAAEGEEIGLFDTDGTTLIDSITFSSQFIDVSYGRYPDGGVEWGFMAGTPNAANSIHNAPPIITDITHTPVSPTSSDAVWLTCMVSDDNVVVSVTLIYDTGSGPVNIRMNDDGAHNDNNAGDGIFGTSIPPLPKETIVNYYVIAADNVSAESINPAGAPDETYFYVVDYIPPKLYINEFMADNDSLIEDPDEPNAFEDWIEIYNASVSPVDISRMHLTDDLANPTQWQVPEGIIIAPGGYQLFWADNDEGQGVTHTGFKLAAEGEEIGLFGPDGITLVDSITFGAQLIDVSYGRYPDGDTTSGFMSATPGSANRPYNAPPSITGTAHIPSTPAEGERVWVTSTVTDDNIVARVTLTYDTGSGRLDVTMYDDGMHNDDGSNDGIYGAYINAFSKDVVVDYFITAEDNLGAQFTDPIKAPDKAYFYIVGYTPPLLFINEFMADNNNTIEDPEDPNSYEDWIEIYNASESTMDIGGMYLTDNLANFDKWQIPQGVSIPARGYFLFWADSDEDQGVAHTSFKLDKDGGEIGLFDINAKRNMPIDAITFGKQFSDNSCGRIYDGHDPWILSKNVTPGYANAFPVGSHTIIWTLPYHTDSYTLMMEMGDCVSAIHRFNIFSGTWDTAYLLWGEPSGDEFSIEPGLSYGLSITSLCSSSF
ncbi:MAG: lamin tail domain-containing protein [bacterium]